MGSSSALGTAFISSINSVSSAGSRSITSEMYGTSWLAWMIWLTVGTSAVINSESPALKLKLRVPIMTRLLPCNTRQARGRVMA
ncbi:hypothetical protein N619_16610 [Ectopseudomonas oleovorans]|nr:hypothetical protein N619_16610 [Pseudomonas oleovorans]